MIQENYSLAQLNTFGIPCIAQQFAEIHQPSQLTEVIQAAGFPEKILLLGGGSNVLLPDRFSGLVIHNKVMGIEVVAQEGDEVIISAGSGVNWHELVLWTIRQGFSGIENMALIPGTVGAAPIQNIGAYGIELKDVFERLNAVDLSSSEERNFSKEDCHFGYRNSFFKKKLIAGKFYLSKIYLRIKHTNHQLNTSYGAIQSQLERWRIEAPTPADVAAAVISIRRSKLPDWRQYGNAGSFFKNPIIARSDWDSLKQAYPDAPHYSVGAGEIKVPAGWLIDQAGWKGRTIGKVGCYKKQALVIVNHGEASGQEIYDFSTQVAESVKEKFGIGLEREVRLIK
ncbi:MAG: UDP-N-acetylmuramate dehydrogenase [Bacteroidota bacterium]